MICIPQKRGAAEEIKILEDVSHYWFSSNFNIFENAPYSKSKLPPFPRVTDVKLPQLERELSRVSRFDFSNGIVGYFEVGDKNEYGLKCFGSDEYRHYSRGFVKKTFYEENRGYLDSEGAFNSEARLNSSGGILPSIYFVESDDGIVKVFMKNYLRRNPFNIEEYEMGMNVKIGLSPRSDGEVIRDSLKDRIISLYGNGYKRVDLNN